MAVLERSELEASPLADLHAIADQVGLDGFRRLRKADLVDAILGETVPAGGAESDTESEAGEPPAASSGQRPRRTRPVRSRRSREGAAADADADDVPARLPRDGDDADFSAGADADIGADSAIKARRGRRRGARAGASPQGTPAQADARADGGEELSQDAARIAAGVVEVLGNGSAFLRVDPPEPSDQDVYISAAQVRRCELVSGDRVTGPVRTPRRSERYPSLVRIDTINGESADTVSDGARYDELAVDWPRERLAFGSRDATL